MRRLAICLAAVSLLWSQGFAENSVSSVRPLGEAVHHPNASHQGIVVAAERRAAKIGAKILAQGGNAADAAVAVGFALAVTFPRAGNIGGGGFMLVHMADEDETVAIDYRETAPAAASRDMYLDENGAVDNDAIRASHRASGVPGTVAGLLYAHDKYGKLSRRQVMAPAIRLAERGYPISYFAAAMLEDYREALSRNDAARAMFFKPGGAGYQPGEVIKHRALARTLRAISRRGRDGFYKGWVADAIANDMAANGGLITREDLASYKVAERMPLVGTYRGLEVHSMPPPSSGGVHLIQMLNMLETRAPQASGGDSADALHFLAEIMRYAFADRAEYLGDTDFVDAPVDGLIAKEYAAALAANIQPDKAGVSTDIGPGDPYPYDSPETTHFSVIDRDGNMVANTYTLNLSFGSKIVIPGTGIVMNNEMDDFSAAPGAPNFFGLVGNEKNAIEPGKRPLSSMTPALLFKDGAPFMAVGGAGGSRIITSVLQLVINVVDRGMNVADATDHPRIHHQWLPDQILYEPGISEDTKRLLEAKGHKLEPFDWYARPRAALHEDGWFYGYSDTRMPGGAACSPDAGC